MHAGLGSLQIETPGLRVREVPIAEQQRAQRIAHLSEDIDERFVAYAGVLWRRRRERPPTRP